MYMHPAITPVHICCLPLLTSVPPAQPAYPLLPGLIHRTRPVIPPVLMWGCPPTIRSQGKYHQMKHNLCCHCDEKCVSLVLLRAKPTCQPVLTWLLLVCSCTHHIAVDFISQNGNAVSGGHWGKKASLHCYSNEPHVYDCPNVWLWPQLCSKLFRIFTLLKQDGI